MVMKPQNVNREVMEKMLTSIVIPSIVAKWPLGYSKNVRIQQDNTKPHCNGNHPGLKEAIHSAALVGFNITLENQPPNSPDLNVLDLAFFASIQSIQHKIPAKNTRELVDAVLQPFESLKVDCCENVWTTLQMVQNEIIGCRGGNNYKLPHMGKAKYRRKNDGRLPLQIQCTHIEKIANAHQQCNSLSDNVVHNFMIQPNHGEICIVGNNNIVDDDDEEALGNKAVNDDDVTNNVVDLVITNETNKEHDVDKDSPIDNIGINNESKPQTAEEFEGLGFKDNKPIGGTDGLGNLDFTEKLDDVILWGDNDSEHDQKICNDGYDDRKITLIESEKEKKDNHSNKLAVVRDVVKEMVTQIDLMNQIAKISLLL